MAPESLADAAPVGGGRRDHCTKSIEVDSGAEMLGRRREDDDGDVRVGVEERDCLRELGEEVRSEGVVVGRIREVEVEDGAIGLQI